jgi:hypothetical protein
MSLDALTVALRESVIDAIGAGLDLWGGQPAVFTRVPVPKDAPARIAIVMPEAAVSDSDGLTSPRPIVQRDVAVYGRKGEPGSAEDQTRAVEADGYALRDHFHRKKFSVRPVGFSVIDVQARGPIVAPADDDETIGRIVSLVVRLRGAT